MKITKKQMKNKKYFIVSDIHSYLDELLAALVKSSLDLKNPNHILVIDGDVFDRGHQTVALYKWLIDFPQDRLILIHGNHDDLLFSLLSSNVFPEDWQFRNGTVKTICAMAYMDDEYGDEVEEFLDRNHHEMYDYVQAAPEATDKWEEVKKLAKESPIYKWMQSDKWINYLELDKFIITHSFIPVNIKEKYALYHADIIYNAYTQFMHQNKDWRKADQKTWYESMWGRPYLQFDAGLFNMEKRKGKVLVVGHYRCSAFHEHYEPNIHYIDGNHDIYFGDNLIAIDATTAWSHQVNVLEIDENGIVNNREGTI